MDKRQVIFAKKNDNGDRITQLGYLKKVVTTENGKKKTDFFYYTANESLIIERIRSGWEFFVYKGGKKVKLEIVDKGKTPYLKTENDGDKPDNLLALPVIPNTVEL